MWAGRVLSDMQSKLLVVNKCSNECVQVRLLIETYLETNTMRCFQGGGRIALCLIVDRSARPGEGKSVICKKRKD